MFDVNLGKQSRWTGVSFRFTLDLKSRKRETSNLSTDADSSTDTTVGWTKNTQKPKNK